MCTVHYLKHKKTYSKLQKMDKQFIKQHITRSLLQLTKGPGQRITSFTFPPGVRLSDQRLTLTDTTIRIYNVQNPRIIHRLRVGAQDWTVLALSFHASNTQSFAQLR